MSKIDLHTHSIVSLDGEFSPAKLADICKANGVEVFALSDHNSTDGVAAAVEAGRERGVGVVPAIELDCEIEGVGFHLLGYGIDYADRRFGELNGALNAQIRANAKTQIELISALGIALDVERIYALSRDGLVIGETIAEVAIEDPRNAANPLVAPYLAGGERSDNPFVNFYWDFCSAGKAADVPMTYISFDEALSLIKSTGGAAAVAHPKNNFKGNDGLLKKVIEKGVWGIEAYSSYHAPTDVEHYCRIADSFGLVKTAGSDFHGKTKPSVSLGGIAGGLDEQALISAVKALRAV